MATPGGFPESSSAYAPPRDDLELEPSTNTGQTPIQQPGHTSLGNQHMAVQSRAIDRALSLLGISDTKKDLIQIGMFGKISNTGNLANLHQASLIDTYILYQTMSYRQRPNTHGDVLFFDFCEDFENWTRTDFVAADLEIRRALRDTLRYRGVYTGKGRSRADLMLAKLVILEHPPQWPDDELIDANFDPNCNAYRRKAWLQYGKDPNKSSTFEASSRTASVIFQSETSLPTCAQPFAYPSTPKQSFQGPPLWRNPNIVQSTNELEQLPQAKRVFESQPLPDDLGDSSDDSKHDHPPRRNDDNKRLKAPQDPPFDSQDPSYHTLPPIVHQDRPLSAPLISHFVKTWDKAMCYSGEPYDIIDDKILYFFSICKALQIHPSQFGTVFQFAVKDRAKTYLLHHLRHYDTFAAKYNQIKLHFDTEINRHQYYTDWTSITFGDYVRKHTDKGLPEVLELMLDKLQMCQRALGPAYSSEKQLVVTTTQACRGIRAFDFALFTPAETFEKLSSQLRTSLQIYSSRKHAAATNLRSS